MAKKKNAHIEREPEQKKQTYVRPKVRKDWFDELDYDIPEKLADEIRVLEDRAQANSQNSQAKEQIQEAHELNAEAVRDYKLPNQQLIDEMEEARIGNRLWYLRFLEKLRANGIKAWYNEQPFRGLIGLRCVVPHYEQKGLQYICGVQMGWMAEYDAYHYDEYGNPLNKKRVGWRSVLLMLIAKKVLSEKDAHRIFGAPTLGKASVIYREALWQMRNAQARGQEIEVVN